MIKTKITYRSFFLLLTIFYGNFFIFSPYFHHHHPEKELLEGKGEIIYSHIFNDCCEETCCDKHEHSFEHNNHHAHEYEICFVNNVIPTKEEKPNIKLVFLSKIEAADEQLENPEYVLIDSDLTFIQQYEQLVFRASDSSPPTS